MSYTSNMKSTQSVNLTDLEIDLRDLKNLLKTGYYDEIEIFIHNDTICVATTDKDGEGEIYYYRNDPDEEEI